MPSLDPLDRIASMKATMPHQEESHQKRKVIIGRCPPSKDGQLFYLMDKDSFETILPLPQKDATIPQVIAASKDRYEICGFLSHGFIIPLVGLVPGHEDLRIEDVRKKLAEALAKKTAV